MTLLTLAKVTTSPIFKRPVMLAPQPLVTIDEPVWAAPLTTGVPEKAPTVCDWMFWSR